MQYENYIKIIEVFNEFGLNIKDFICLPPDVWKRIKQDYTAKYKENKKPELEDFKTGVKKRLIKSTKTYDTEEKFINDALEYFDENELKIVEE